MGVVAGWKTPAGCQLQRSPEWIQQACRVIGCIFAPGGLYLEWHCNKILHMIVSSVLRNPTAHNNLTVGKAIILVTPKLVSSVVQCGKEYQWHTWCECSVGRHLTQNKFQGRYQRLSTGGFLLLTIRNGFRLYQNGGSNAFQEALSLPTHRTSPEESEDLFTSTTSSRHLTTSGNFIKTEVWVSSEMLWLQDTRYSPYLLSPNKMLRSSVTQRSSCLIPSRL